MAEDWQKISDTDRMIRVLEAAGKINLQLLDLQRQVAVTSDLLTQALSTLSPAMAPTGTSGTFTTPAQGCGPSNINAPACSTEGSEASPSITSSLFVDPTNPLPLLPELPSSDSTPLNPPQRQHPRYLYYVTHNKKGMWKLLFFCGAAHGFYVCMKYAWMSVDLSIKGLEAWLAFR
jgi:hypothetical protein